VGGHRARNRWLRPAASLSAFRATGFLRRPHGRFVKPCRRCVDLSNNSAEYGYVGAVNHDTKSGTNKFHGKAFDYYKSGGLSAHQPVRPVSLLRRA
jgi:hypothetical protein